jgi:carboxymethylenebutenolidase
MGEMVSFPSNGKDAEGYLAKPASGKGLGLIVIQEWWGLNDNIKNIAERFAKEGYVALAPDLYHGKVTAEPDEAMKIMMSMQIDQAARDLSGAVDYLANSDATTGSKLGSIGWCMGGGLSLVLATLKPQIGACVIYYGVVQQMPELKNINGPILGHYAEHDAFASPEAARALAEQLKGLGKQVEIHIYPGTEHAFFNDTRSEVYKPDAAKLSWERTLAFYKQNLS